MKDVESLYITQESVLPNSVKTKSKSPNYKRIENTKQEDKNVRMPLWLHSEREMSLLT